MRRLFIIAAMTLAGCEEIPVGPYITNAQSDYAVDIPPEDPLLLVSVVIVEDPDGDVTTAAMRITDQLGSSLLAGGSVTGFEHQTLASLYMGVEVIGAVPGPYELEVWVTDSEGFESNHVTTIATVVDPAQ